MKTHPEIVLASTSPRRIELLAQAGLRPRVEKPDTDETPVRGESPKTMVARLAREKAESVAARLLAAGLAREPLVIVAADTTVVAPGGKTVLGKPGSVAEAHRMLGRLSGRAHTVLTGYCVLGLTPAGQGAARFRSRVLGRVVTSRVTMRKLSKGDIARYVETGEPMDKAGAYGAQGIGMTLIQEIHGSYTNVVGLPVAELLEDLKRRFGVAPA